MKKLILFIFLSFVKISFGQQSYFMTVDGTNKKLEVFGADFDLITYEEAKLRCQDLGDGWRIPTKEEMNSMCIRKDRLELDNNWYWCKSTNTTNPAWSCNISNCSTFANYGSRNTCLFRPVRNR